MTAPDREPSPERIRTPYSGRWLRFRVATYRDRAGRDHEWEFVDREGLRPAALIVARLRPSGDLLLVSQHRAPVGGRTVEFPAGLVDEGETVSEAALRELREETGHTGQVRRLSPALAVSPGLTSEQAYLVEVDVPENAPANRAPRPGPDEGEQIEVLRVSRDGALEELNSLAGQGLLIDARVWAWVTAGLPDGGHGAGGARS